MRAAIFHEFGSPEVIRIEDVPVPEPGYGEALIRVHAVSLNHVDLWVRRGAIKIANMPHIGGCDIAGVIELIDRPTDRLRPGTRVIVNATLFCGECRECRRGEESQCATFRILGEHVNGGLAEYAVVPVRNLYPIPDDISSEVAACLPISYQTAWRAVVGKARVRPGEDVLVLGASGGTALAAMQIALLAGARVFAVTSGEENYRRIEELGAHVVLDREQVDFSSEVYALTGRRGVDVVVENVGAATWQGSVRALASGGRLVTFGATTGPEVGIDIRRLFWKQLQLIGTTMASRREFEEMLRLAWAGRLQPIIDSVYSLEDTRAAHERLESGAHFGKVVVRVGG